MNGYLLFHTVAELFSVIIAAASVTVAWNARRYLKCGFFIWLAAASAAVGTLDLAHTLAYKGMGVFHGDTANLATQLWIAGRWLAAGALVLAPFWVTRPLRFGWVAAGFAAVTAGFFLAVFAGLFPDCFRPGTGLTTFKIGSEYAVCALYLVSIALFWRQRARFEPLVFRLCLTGLLIAIASELAFTLYTDVYGVSNMLGHLLKIAAFALLYQAIVVTGVQRPFEALFRDLQASEQRYAAIHDHAPFAVALMRSSDGVITEINEAWERFFDCPREKAIGRTSLDLDLASDPESRAKMYQEIQQKGFVRNWEMPYRTQTGGERLGSFNFDLIEIGGVKYHLGTTIDITERKKAEMALRESHDRMKKVLEVETVGVMFWDLATGCMTDANDTFLRIMGYSRQEVEARELTWQKLTPPEYIEASRAEITKFMATGRVGPYEKEYFRKDGTRQWFIFAGSSLGDNACVEFCVDITARKKAEEQLRLLNEQLEQRVAERTAELKKSAEAVDAERRRFKDALDQLPAYVVLLAPDYHVPFANRFFEERFGKAEGRRCYEYLFGRNEPCENCKTFKVFKTGEPQGWEWTGPDGRNYDIHDFPFTDADGSRLIMEVGLDVTEVKQAQEALKETNHMLAERTAKLQEMVCELEHFSYTITHDMRAPLRAMQGFSQIVRNEYAGKLDEAGQDYLRRITEASKRMDHLITDALNYSKVVQGQFPLEPIAPKPLLLGMIDSYPQFQPPQAQIEVMGEFPCVMASPSGLTQCFSNLLGNAVKFVQPGNTPKVRVWAEDRGNVIRIWVEDKGIGIPEEQQERIFGLFQRLSKDYEGTGVGLALVRKVMNRMRGKVGFDSKVGEGSRFWIELAKA